jgi:hypothetical protein
MADRTETDLLRRAAKASSLAEATQLVTEANRCRDERVGDQRRARDLDLANALITQTLTPAPVHEHHTAATDWLGEIATDGGAGAETEMIARGSVWYAKTSQLRPFQDEWQEQARGQARKLAGAYGAQADAAENAFLEHVGTLYQRELDAGLFALAASGLPQIGEPGAPVSEATVGPVGATGLPGELTSSERAPIMRSMENNTGGGPPSSSDPSVLSNGNVDADNGDTGTNEDHSRWNAVTSARRGTPGFDQTERNASMQTARCPSCKGHGRVAVRTQGASGLTQIQETVDPNNQAHTEKPPDWSVAFPWEMDPNNQANAIAETEQQLKERSKMKGASRQDVAQQAARRAYAMVMQSAQDDSGWAGDMGAGGNTPGQQDGGNPGVPDNIGVDDPVYGQGGDNPNQPLKPYGEDEADDYTNNPGMNYQPGQPLQYDQGGRVNQAGQATSSLDQDPEIMRAARYIRQRRAYLQEQS